MKTHDLIQGSDAWNKFRLEHFGASEAAAMLGLSKKTSRNELLRMKKTGIAKEFSDWVQKNVLDRGHAVEAPARKIMEGVIGETLYPVTCSDGEISASCDGLDMAEVIAWENKQWNEEYAALVRSGQVPEEHMPQCQQVLMVTKAEKLFFSISDGTRERTVWVEVQPDPAWFARIRTGWDQFKRDLETYEPTEQAVEAVGRAPETLPALHIVLKGEVSASNLAEFKEVALTAIRSVNRDLKTDQDFADSAKARKWCEDIEARVAAAKDHALSQTMSIDLLFRTMDEVSAEARDVRLALEKLERIRKESRKGEIVAGGVKGLADHVEALNARLGKPYMPAVNVDFGGAIKGMRSFDSMQNAVDTALANAKIAASATADRIQVNLATLREHATGLEFLFPDTAQIVQKAPEDLTSLVKTRIAEHRAAEARKEEEQREQLRKEMAMSEIKGIQQQVMIATLGRAGVRTGGTIECIRETLAETEAWPIDAERFGSMASAAQQAKDAAVTEIRALLLKAEARATAATPPASTPSTAPAAVTPLPTTASSAPAAAPAPTVIPLPQRTQPAAGAVPTLSIGAINERLQYFTLTAEGLRGLGFEPAGRERAAPRYHEADFPHMLAAIVGHVQAIQAKQAA